MVFTDPPYNVPSAAFCHAGIGSVVLIVVANGVRLLASAVGALIAIYWFDLGTIGFFVAVAIGFCAFAGMAVNILLRVKKPANTAAVTA